MTTLQDKLDEILELYKRQVLKEENGQFVNYERLNKKEAVQSIKLALLELLIEKLSDAYQPEITDLEANEYRGEDRPVIYLDKAIAIIKEEI